MAPKRDHLSSRSSRKEEKKHARPETTNGTSRTDTTGDDALLQNSSNLDSFNHDTSLQHNSNMHIFQNDTSFQYSFNMHGFNTHIFNNDHSSTTPQASTQHQQQPSPLPPGAYQSINRPWQQPPTTNTTNPSPTNPSTYTTPLSHWSTTPSSSQPWHGISAIRVPADAQTTLPGTSADGSEYDGGETTYPDSSSMHCECASKR